MSNTTIDVRGLSCPEPVVRTQKTINNGIKNFTVLLDSEVSKENVIRCLTKNKLNSKVDMKEDNYVITVTE